MMATSWRSICLALMLLTFILLVFYDRQQDGYGNRYKWKSFDAELLFHICPCYRLRMHLVQESSPNRQPVPKLSYLETDYMWQSVQLDYTPGGADDLSDHIDTIERESVTIKEEPAPKTTNSPVNVSSTEGETDDLQDDDSYDFATAKKILYFTSYFDMKDFAFGFGHEPFVTFNCPVHQCYATNNRSLLPSLADFDAILFHMRDMERKHGRLMVPNQSKRRPQQRYVMFLMESPENDGFPYDKLKGFFNWTMTYRSDSDIPRPYGWIERNNVPKSYAPWREKPKPKWLPYDEAEFKESLKFRNSSFLARAQRPKLVAWIVSNCHTSSRREDYVKLLQKEIPVDIFGGCGDVKCDKPHREKFDNCSQALERDYKFYLSFENSLCNEYVTEKFFRRLAQNVVPVVMGKAQYDNGVAPPHAVINIADFSTPKELAEYLLRLDQNPEEYLSYFWWQDHYQVHKSTNKPESMCDLCKKLHSKTEPPKVYEDMTEWWRNGGDCEKMGSQSWARPKRHWLIEKLDDVSHGFLSQKRKDSWLG